VVVDRRQGDRRQGDRRQGPREQSPSPADPPTDRRRCERRTRPDVDKELYVGGRWGRSGKSHRVPRPGNAQQGRGFPRLGVYVAYAPTALPWSTTETRSLL
jgi:hypothetical protein